MDPSPTWRFGGERSEISAQSTFGIGMGRATGQEDAPLVTQETEEGDLGTEPPKSKFSELRRKGDVGFEPTPSRNPSGGGQRPAPPSVSHASALPSGTASAESRLKAEQKPKCTARPSGSSPKSPSASSRSSSASTSALSLPPSPTHSPSSLTLPRPQRPQDRPQHPRLPRALLVLLRRLLPILLPPQNLQPPRSPDRKAR
jgi:hypothetical protein